MFLRALASVLVAATFVSAQAPRQTVTLILTGGTVVTMDSSGRALSPGAVAIDGRDIVDNRDFNRNGRTRLWQLDAGPSGK